MIGEWLNVLDPVVREGKTRCNMSPQVKMTRNGKSRQLAGINVLLKHPFLHRSIGILKFLSRHYTYLSSVSRN